MEHALPRRTAGIPRTWSLCMTSENHGTVGPAGCTFSHAPEKHERVLVVEAPNAGGAPVDQVNLQLVGARQPVAEFAGYDVDGEPVVTWLARDNMPRVGTKLFVEPVAAQASQVAAPGEQLEWSHDLQKRLVAAGEDFEEDEYAGQLIAEAACLLAALTGIRAPTPGESQEGGAA